MIRDNAGSMGAALHTKDPERLTDPLIDGMWRDAEARSNLFG